MCGAIGRGNHIGNAFGLCQIDLTCKEGSCGEFARCGCACAAVDSRAHNAIYNIGRAVARNLDRIFARIGARCAEKGQYDIVDRITTCRIDDLAIVCSVAFGLCQRPF